MLVGTQLLLQRLTREALVDKEAEVELWVSRRVTTYGVVPDVEGLHLGRVIGAVQEAYLILARLVELVVVVVVEGIDAVVDRSQVLCDEDTILLRTGNLMRLEVEHRRVVVDNLGQRVSLEEVDEGAT